MTEEQFKSQNINSWLELESLNKKMEQRAIYKRTKEEIDNFAYLLQKTSHDLAYSRTHFGETEISIYLNQLIAVSHNYFYIRKKTGFVNIFRYFKEGFPKLVINNSNFFSAAFFSFMLGAVLAGIIVYFDPLNIAYFMSEQQAEAITLQTELTNGGMMAFTSAYIMTNNIRVCILAVGLGITFGVGTLYILFVNGALIGALYAFLIVKFGIGVSVPFFALILPHGFIELIAIFISGAAGLMMGNALIRPRNMTRRDSLIQSTKKAIIFLPGVAIMLVIAGLIEGFITPSSLSDIQKLIFSLATLLLTGFYFYFYKIKTIFSKKKSIEYDFDYGYIK